MAGYKTPGVYVKEIPSLPPSVATVSTAVPAFIGYTQITNRETGKPPVPVRITSLLDYTEQFGTQEVTQFEVTVEGDEIKSVTGNGGAGVDLNFLMYHSLEMYFKNGGGPCYVVSVGSFNDASAGKPKKDDMEAGLSALEKEDEPTLLLLVDGINLDIDDYNALCMAALLQCGELKDRFCIFDVVQNNEKMLDDIQAFRDGVGINNLKYGAAYYPYLRTALNYSYTDDSVAVKGFTDEIGEYKTDENGLRVTYTGPSSDAPKVKIELAGDENFGFTVDSKTLTISLPASGGNQSPSTIIEAWEKFIGVKDKFALSKAGTGMTEAGSTSEAAALTYTAADQAVLADLKYDKTALYNNIKAMLDKERIVLPSSSSIAGVYAFIDGSTGVWKAPANVSLASVIEPTVKLNNRDQEDLNVDANAGKSINVIRAFTGKGNIVWGARTLMGNDNEWRYINVRRLFNFVEESVQKSTAFAVFEPNTPLTWLKVRAMIQSFLEDLWRAGGLAGETTDQAYFVNVGLGETMTEQDILEGRMNVEIGMAAVRPAEFIILKFSHKLQES